MKSHDLDEAPEKQDFRKRVLSTVILIVILGMAVHLLLPQISELEHSIQVIKSMRLWAVGLAVLAQILSYVGSGYLLQAIVALTSVEISLGRSVLITLAAYSIGLIAGGVLGSSAGVYNWMRGSSAKAHTAMLASTLPALINDLVLLVLSVFGLLHLLIVHQLSTLQTVSITLMVVFLGLIMIAIIWGVRHRLPTAAFFESIARRSAQIFHRKYVAGNAELSVQNLFQAWDVLVEGGWQRTALGATLNVGFDMLTLYFLFIAAGYTISPGALFVGYGIPLLLGKMAFIVPGGVGVVEGSMVALYTSLGIPNSVAVVVVLIYRAISFWLPTLIGFPAAAYLQRSVARQMEN